MIEGIFAEPLTSNSLHRHWQQTCVDKVPFRDQASFSQPSYTLPALPLVEMMAQSSNVIINGGIFSSGQGDVHIHNGISEFEFGMHSFGSV